MLLESWERIKDEITNSFTADNFIKGLKHVTKLDLKNAKHLLSLIEHASNFTSLVSINEIISSSGKTIYSCVLQSIINFVILGKDNTECIVNYIDTQYRREN